MSLFRVMSTDGNWTSPRFWATEKDAIDDGRSNRHHLWPSFMFNLQAYRDGEWRFAGSYTTREVEITYISLDGQEEVVSEASFKIRLPQKMLRESYDPAATRPRTRLFLYELEALTGTDCYGVNRARYRAVEEIKPNRVLCPCCHKFKEESLPDIAARLGVQNPLASSV